jgi:putative ABC transport system substrate-binding protein
MTHASRRAFVLGGIAMATAGLSHAQRDQQRLLGVLMGYAESDAEARVRLAAFMESLAALGWAEGKNLRVAVRWTGGDAARVGALARELVALKPDVILTSTTPASVAVHRETREIPIVFTVVSDPVGSGLVKSLARPGGNVTGLINVEASIASKSLELLKEIRPALTQVAVMFNPSTAPFNTYYLETMRTHAKAYGAGIEVVPVASESQIAEGVEKLRGCRTCGLVAMTDSFLFVHRRTLIDACARNKVLAISFVNVIAREGGLLSYGPNFMELFRGAAPFVDRILRGRTPGEMPVEQPTKFEMVINMKTAAALGVTFPASVRLLANEVIQ